MNNRSGSGALAMDGGTPVRSEPFPPRGNVTEDEKAAVTALFDAAIAGGSMPGYNGEQETAYCEEFSQAVGGGFADAVSSGTAALYVALRALELEPFTEVIVGAVTDPGGMMPIPLLNLVPVIADVAPGSYNTGPDQVAELISPLTSAIVVPHIGGEPADIAGIVALAKARGIPVIEDCAQSHGAALHGRPIGAFGDLAVFSTMFGKHHSTGGQGGLVFTRDERLYQAVRRASDRGKPFFMPPGSTNVMASLNLNLNDLAAAIGRVQLRKLPAYIARRRQLVQQLAEGLATLRSVALPASLPGASPSYWFLRLQFHPESVSCDKRTFCRALAAEGLPISEDYRAALPHTMEWYARRRVFGSSQYPWSSPDYKGDPKRAFLCPNVRQVMDSCFNLYLHEGWTDRDLADALAVLEKVEAAFSRD